LAALNTELRAHLKKALLLFATQTAFLASIRTQVPGADQDRLLRDLVFSLKPLKFQQGHELVRSLLDSVESLRVHSARVRDPLWPINAQELRSFFGPGDALVARKVIFRARELFDAARGCRGAEQHISLEEFLGQELEKRRMVAITKNDTSQSESTLKDGLPLLLHGTGWTIAHTTPAMRNFDLVANKVDRKIAIAVLGQENSTAIAKRLGRILEDKHTHGRQIVLVRDARLGFPKTAKVLRERVEKITSEGGILLEVLPEAVAALEALRSLLAEAEAGDLSNNGESIGGEFVERWMGKHMPAELDSILGRLSSPLKGSEAHDSDLRGLLADLIAERRVLSVPEAATELGRSQEEIASCARRHADSIGYLEGNPSALFFLVAGGGA
jgi:hypothetical protein